MIEKKALTTSGVAKRLNCKDSAVRSAVDQLDVVVFRAGLYRIIDEADLPKIKKWLDERKRRRDEKAAYSPR